MKGITSLAHVAIKTRDLDASLDFYVNRMGFPEMLRLSKPDGSPGVWLVYLRITDDQFLEIFPEGQGERAPGWNDTAINHICLGVDDIDAVIAGLEAAGVPLLLPRKEGADGNVQAWVEDPDGNRIELMQMMPGNLQEQAIERLRRAARDRVPA